MNIIHVGNFYMTESIAQLTDAMAKASQEFGELVKDTKNPFFKSTYADLASHITATRGQLGKHGLVLFQSGGMSESGPIITTILSHASGELIGNDLPMPASKLDAQGIGSAITYGRRYALGPLLNIAGEEDDDANAAVGSRKDHLEKLDRQMESQERISHVQMNAWLKTAVEHGRTEQQIIEYLEELGGYKQPNEILKGEWDQAKKWALNQGSGEEDLTKDLEPSVRSNLITQLWTVAGKKKQTKAEIYDLVHDHLRETYKKKSVKELDAGELNQTIKWLEAQKPSAESATVAGSTKS